MVNKLLTAVVALVCILLGYLLYSTLEFYEESTDAGWTFEARRNPYLATQLLLQRLGSQAESSDAKSAIDRLDDFDSLLITNSSLVVNQAMADELIRWVDKGGELVIGADETRGKLLEQLDVEYKAVVYRYEDGEEAVAQNNLSPVEKALDQYGDKNNRNICKKCDEDNTLTGCEECAKNDAAGQWEPKKKFSDILKETNRKNHEKSLEQANEASGNTSSSAATEPKPEIIPERRITHVGFTGYEQDLNIAFSPWSTITHPALDQGETGKKTEQDKSTLLQYTPFYWAGSHQGVHLMQFYIGDGMITVVSDATIWNSQQLGRLDHGFLLRVFGFRGSSLILYGVAMPSIVKLAWTKFPELIITLSLLMIFWLWQKAIRVGPLKQLNSTARRSIMDSILGLASYLHKRKKYSHLLQPILADILLSANRQISGFTQADQAKKETLISEHSGLSQNAIARALNLDAVQDDEAFQDIISLLRKIRKTL